MTLEENQLNQPKPAGFFIRLAAGITDIMIISAILIIAEYALEKFIGHNINGTVKASFIAIYLAVGAISQKQATPAKRLFKIYVATKDNQKLSTQRALAKYFILIIIFIAIQFAAITYIISIDQVSNLLIQNNHDIQTQMAIAYTAVALTIITFVPLIFASMFFTKDKVALHDIISGSRTFRGKI